MPSQYTKEAMSLFNALVQAKLPVQAEVPIEREEKNREGKSKVFVIDLLIGKSLAVEVEGKGSSSKNNHERDEFLKSEGYTVLHVSNALVKHDLFTAVKLVKVVNSLILDIQLLKGKWEPSILLRNVLETLTKEV